MSQYRVRVNGKEHDVTVTGRAGSKICFVVENTNYEVEVENAVSVVYSQQAINATPAASPFLGNKASASSPHEIRAPMPGLIIDIKVKAGDKVTAGQIVCVMEAMKMENNITAHHAAKVKKVHIKPQQEVENGALLVELTS